MVNKYVLGNTQSCFIKKLTHAMPELKTTAVKATLKASNTSISSINNITTSLTSWIDCSIAAQAE
jgi:hypothetical protein